MPSLYATLYASCCHHLIEAPTLRLDISSAFTTIYDSIFSAWRFDAFMPFTRVMSPPSIRVHDHNGSHGRRRSITRPAGIPFSSPTPGPMAIPNTRHALAPPPLPPPRFIDDLTAGSDPGWAWGNDPSGKFGKAGGSTASVGNFPKTWSREREDKMQAQSPDRPQQLHRDSVAANTRPPRDTHRRHHDFARHQDEGYYSLSGSGISVMSQQSVFAFLLRVSTP